MILYSRKLFLGFFLTCLVFSICGCSLKVSEPSTFRSLKITGRLTQSSVSNVIEKIQSSPIIDKIYINSGGGDETATLALAREIARREIDLVVDGACISACAHLLLPAAKRVYIYEDSVIGFHTNIFGWLEHFWTSDKSNYDKRYGKAADMAKFLDKRGVDLGLLFCADTLHEPSYATLQNSSGGLAKRSNYNFLQANLETVKRYGVNVQDVRKQVVPIRTLLQQSNVSLKGVRKDWSWDDCKAVNTSVWKQVESNLFKSRE